jgi:hypothetical protein
MDHQSYKKALQNASIDTNILVSIYFTLFYLREIYTDGYEDVWLDMINIDSSEIVNSFNNNGDKVEWNKDLWNRIFSEYNTDELDRKSTIKYEKSKAL